MHCNKIITKSRVSSHTTSHKHNKLSFSYRCSTTDKQHISGLYSNKNMTSLLKLCLLFGQTKQHSHKEEEKKNQKTCKSVTYVTK